MIAAIVTSVITHVEDNTFELELETHITQETYKLGPFPRSLAFPAAIACIAAYHADPLASISFPFLGGFTLSGLDNVGSILLALNPDRLASDGLVGLLTSLALGAPS